MAYFSSALTRVTAGTGVLLCLAFVSGVGPSTDALQTYLRGRIEAAERGETGPLVVEGAPLRMQTALARYYEQHAFEPGWVAPSGPTPLVDSLVAALRGADREGLRPADYSVDQIDALRRGLRARAEAGEPVDTRGLVDLELLCTDAFLRYASHLAEGRLTSDALTPTTDADPEALVRQLEAALADTPVATALDQLRPPQPEYNALMRALARYRRLADAGGWPSVPDGPTLKTGMFSERVPAVRQRLQATGDLPAAASPDTTVLDSALVAAVMQFQTRHGLTPDGAVGPATLAALNVPASERARQIKVGLERWRWRPDRFDGLHVIVNIAAYELRVLEDGSEALRMRVVTGTPYRQTPVFSDEISYLVFNPYWHVPHRLATQDKLPDFQRDPSLVSRLGFEVFRGWGADAQPLDPARIDWSNLSTGNFPYRLRQKPGPQNALGEVKFMFPNPHSVYLHDTPSRSLFARSERSFSSGCIRVEEPLALAALLLRDTEGWTPERIRSVIGQNTEQAVTLRRPVPVHLLYQTAWAEGNSVHFRRDVYQRDGAVAQALDAPLPTPADLSDN